MEMGVQRTVVMKSMAVFMRQMPTVVMTEMPAQKMTFVTGVPVRDQRPPVMTGKSARWIPVFLALDANSRGAAESPVMMATHAQPPICVLQEHVSVREPWTVMTAIPVPMILVTALKDV
jgi:hypothetical protein